MSITEMNEIYNEFQAILKKAEGIQSEVIEKKDLISINFKHQISIELLKKLDYISYYFGVYCNPFHDQSDDIIYQVESGARDIKDIESITVSLEKHDVLRNMSYIDMFFLDVNSAVKSLREIKAYEHKINIIIPNIKKVETDLLNFIPLNYDLALFDIDKIPIRKDILKKIYIYLNSNKQINQSFYLNPYAFNLTNQQSKDRLSNIIRRYYYLVVFEYLSDKIENNSFVIRGERNVFINISDSFDTEHYTNLIDILEFLISEEKYAEKLLITKKVFSLYISHDEDLNSIDTKLTNIHKTIKHYYNHYVEDDVKDFFRTKDQLLKEAMGISKLIYEQTDKINTSITASLLSIILILVTTLYRMIEDLTTSYFFIILITFIIFSIVYCFIIKTSSEKRFGLTKIQFDYFLREISIIQGEEVEELKYTYLEKPYKEMKRTLKMLYYILISVNLIILISFLFFYFI